MKGPLFVLAVDHRLVMVKACQERGLDLARLREFKALAVEALADVRQGHPRLSEHMLALVDDQHGRDALEVAGRRGFGVGIPVEEGGVVPLEFSRPDWEAAIVGRRPALIKVRFNGGPYQDPRQREAQEERVLRISQACQRAQVPFFPEPLLDPHPKGITDLERAQVMADWTSSLRARGVLARYWKLEGFEDPAAARLFAKSVPQGEDVLLLGGTGTREHLVACFQATRGISRYQGFSVGRNIFWEPYLAFLTGGPADEARAGIQRRYLEVVSAWEEVTGLTAS